MASPGREMPGIQALPPELLTHIFSYLDRPAPSDSRLHDEPHPAMLRNEPSSNFLKTISLVSKRWRTTILPSLFRHVRWAFDRWDLLMVEPGRSGAHESDPASALPLLAFLRANDLGRHVDTLTLIIGDSMQGIYRLTESGRPSDTTVPRHGSPTARPAEQPSSPVPRPMSLAEAQAGRGGGQRPGRQAREKRYGEDNNWFWEVLFETMDPRRFTMIASPRMLSSLLSRMLFVGDAWSFKSQCHILSLSREDRRGPLSEEVPSDQYTPTENGPSIATQASSSTETAAGSSPTTGDCPNTQCHNPPERIRSALFTIRPWTSLLLNEGSSMPVYKTYEFFLKRPPSILGALLGCEEPPNDAPLVPPSVRSLSYVAMFPLSSHFNTLVGHLPPLDRLFVQLVPRTAILDDPDEMHCIDAGDLWMERNT